VFADDSGVDGTWVYVETFAEDVAQAFGVEEGVGADDLTGGYPDSFWAMKVRTSTGLVAMITTPSKPSAMSFWMQLRTMTTLPVSMSRRDLLNFAGVPTVRMAIELDAASL
jgi:hypothetical protein